MKIIQKSIYLKTHEQMSKLFHLLVGKYNIIL